MLVLGAQAIEALMPLQRCIAVVADAMQAVSRGEVLAPLRTIMPLGGSDAMGIMPGAMPVQGCFGVKVLALYPGNTALGLSSHAGVVVLFDAGSGVPMAVLESNALTALRTAAASAVATRALARSGGQVLALLGAGHQALWHARALAHVMPLARLQIWSRSRATADKLVHALELAGQPEIVIADDVQTAIRDADVICSVSAAPEPILRGKWLVAGQHVNLVGASVASAREADTTVVQRSRFFVDARASAQVQAGEWLRALETGAVTPDHLCGEIGEVLSGHQAGRLSAHDITVYKSLGHTAQDLATAQALVQLAQDSGRYPAVAW